VLHSLHILASCSSFSCCHKVLSHTDANGATPLHVAAHCGNAAAVRLLIACAKQHNIAQFAAASEGSGRSALWLAAAAGHVDTVVALLQASPPAQTVHANTRHSKSHLVVARGCFYLTRDQENISFDTADALQVRFNRATLRKTANVYCRFSGRREERTCSVRGASSAVKPSAFM
jgi:hypothetical protein